MRATRCLPCHYRVRGFTYSTVSGTEQAFTEHLLNKGWETTAKGIQSWGVYCRRSQPQVWAATSCARWVQRTRATLKPALDAGSTMVKRKDDISTWLELKWTRFGRSLKSNGLNKWRVHFPCPLFQNRKKETAATDEGNICLEILSVCVWRPQKAFNIGFSLYFI